MKQSQSSTPAEQAPNTISARICLEPGCEKRLRSYNRSGYCVQHHKHKTTTHCVRGGHYTGARPTPEQLDQLYNEQQLSSSEIAQQYGVTRKTVTNWLEKVGIERRTGHEAGMLRFLAQSEFVPPEEREDCLLDRAWEARPERRIKNKVACRLSGCFRQVSRLTGKYAHFSTSHEGMTGDEYTRLMPGHRHDCFQHTADTNGLEVEKLMDDWCTEWATADEIRHWRRDPKLAQAKEYVGCLECGRKLFGMAEIQKHLGKVHNWTLEQYRERYPGAPTGSLDRRSMQAKKTNKRYHKLKADAERGRAQQAQQQSGEKRQTKETGLRITLAAHLFTVNPDARPDYAMAGRIFPKQNVMPLAYDATVKFLKRHGEAIETEKRRLLSLSGSERRLEAENARSQL